MSAPNFSTALDVQKFLESNSDSWCRPIVEEYIALCSIGNDEELSVEELNGWIEYEMQTLTKGYEEWLSIN
tara:strand:+ start:2111 stop:2323 length:213 start_codon:yes stop_codon:yes gene_type:complete